MSRPLIAVTGSYDANSGNYYVKKSYMDAIWQSGGAPLIIAPQADCPAEWSGDRDELVDRADIFEEILDKADGLLITGGEDVDPNFYGDRVEKECGEIVPMRDAWEIKLIRFAHERNIPCLGICRGIQSMAVALGADLVQDLYTHGDVTNMRHQQKAPSWYPTHRVITEEGTTIRRLLGETCWVNSFHHQCIAPEHDQKQPLGFTVSAYATDGIIEAMEDSSRTFFVGVQWHPERMMSDPVQRSLFKALVDASSK